MIATLIAVVILGGIAWGILHGIGAERPWLQATSLARAVVQLGVLSIVLRWVIVSLPLTFTFLAVMTIVATVTALGRTPTALRRPIPIGVGIVLSWTVPVGVILSLGAVPTSPAQLLAIGGIVIGNSMTVTALITRNLASRLEAGFHEYIAWLSLGATPRQAARPEVRRAVSMSVMPATDQTRTTGLVTLPGAFVGSIFGGASVLDAAQFQLLVLAAILATSAITALVLTIALGAPKTMLVRHESHL